MDYKRIYDTIIDKARLREEIDGYYEKHHIIPKSLGGSDEENNLVKLTFKEHYLCHRLLVKIYPDENKMHYAFWTMSTNPKDNNLRISARCYAEARENFINCKLGVPLSEETKKKISIANTGKVRTQEMKNEMSKIKKANPSDHWVGKKHSKESKQKMSESAKNRNITEENELIRRKKISETHTGKSKSEEHIKKFQKLNKERRTPCMEKKVNFILNLKLYINIQKMENFYKCEIMLELLLKN